MNLKHTVCNKCRQAHALSDQLDGVFVWSRHIQYMLAKLKGNYCHKRE